jgi:hypothetical protein
MGNTPGPQTLYALQAIAIWRVDELLRVALNPSRAARPPAQA